jgi:hypothetical protein
VLVLVGDIAKFGDIVKKKLATKKMGLHRRPVWGPEKTCRQGPVAS